MEPKIMAHNGILGTLQPCTISDVCRLCANLDSNMIPIYADEGIVHMLENKIKIHLPFINISKNDLLPKRVCYHCASAVLVWNELYECSSDADQRLRSMFEAANSYNLNECKVQYDDIEGIHVPVKDFIVRPIEYEEITDVNLFNKNDKSDKTLNELDKVPSTSKSECILSHEDKSSDIQEDERLNPTVKRYSFGYKSVHNGIGNNDLLTQNPIGSCSKEAEATVISGGDIVVAGLSDLYRRDACDLSFSKVSDKQLHLETTCPEESTAVEDDRRYECNVCAKSFRVKRHMIRHLRRNFCRFDDTAAAVRTEHPSDGGGEFKCGICADYKTDEQREWYEHLRRHSDGRSFMCDLCNRVYDTKIAISCHVMADHLGGGGATRRGRPFKGDTPFTCWRRERVEGRVCIKCDKTFISPQAVFRHTEFHNEDSLCCRCRKRKVGEEHHGCVVDRSQRRSSSNFVLSYHCEYCVKKFDVRAKLSRHVKTHKRYNERWLRENWSFDQRFAVLDGDSVGYKCDRCSYYCVGNKRQFTDHYRKHTGEKPFACDRCDKRFGSRSLLRRHASAVHQGIKKYACDVCGRRFAEKRNVEDHLRTHTGEKPFVCSTCGKCFSQRASLGIHDRVVHLRVRNHKCTVCDKSFGMKSDLTYHLKWHWNEKDYVCSVCGKAFLYNQSLQRHKMTIHSNVRPFSCEVCGRTFKLDKNLKRHGKMHQRKELVAQ